MRKIAPFIILIFFSIQCFAQKQYLETFDSKESIKRWKIRNNGVLLHTDHFTYDGKTFYKPTKDSFLVFYDSTFNWNYSINLSRTFKVIPSQDINFRFSLFSNDSFEDRMYFSYRIFDKNKKNLHWPTFPATINNYEVNIIGAGIQLPDKIDSLWLKADSMEISFHFNPTHPYDSFNRMVVIDEIFLNKIYASVKDDRTSVFNIFPNPVSKTLYFTFPSLLKPKIMYVNDYTGRTVLISQGMDELNIENIKPGFYFVTVLYETGLTATQKVEIR